MAYNQRKGVLKNKNKFLDKVMAFYIIGNTANFTV